MRVAIGAQVGDWAGGIGGIAQYNSFTNSLPNVVYVFIPETTRTPVWIGDFASHEAAHSFGLYHQTTTNFSVLMCAGGIGSNLCTWYNGETSPGVFQDDMAVLANTTNGFGYRSDDVGNTTASATALSTADNTWSGAGIVGTNTDVDMFSFHVTTEDTYRMAVNGIPLVSNLDVALELRNSAGQLIASANPQDTRSAAIVKGLTPGDYYLSVKSSGIYGQIGQYTVNIDAPPPGITVTPASGAMTTGEDGRQATFAVVLQTQPTANVLISISSTNLAEGTLSAASLIFTATNWDIAQVVTITGVDDTIVGNDTAYSVIIGAATKLVYQYTAAASRISGSQAAAVTFALAAGNTNPQGIADPPAPGSMLPTQPRTSSVAVSQAMDAAIVSLMGGQTKAGNTETTSTVSAKPTTDSSTSEPSHSCPTEAVVSAQVASTTPQVNFGGRRDSAVDAVDEALTALADDDLKIDLAMRSLARSLA